VERFDISSKRNSFYFSYFLFATSILHADIFPSELSRGYFNMFGVPGKNFTQKGGFLQLSEKRLEIEV